ncbi:interferon-inducible double-stranded RNA-dependent protein kinase activator A homolog [Erpetoichthys calabaricus]|uniref:interferon-inducible double-stranded RNA-dependent protein kinase activator A homolog n=1 Tax=Erpetoichthys calabaricus TaxID=27687 RepID=UPI0022347E5E|nr:interferon-inducible double-stranded RNA-dependent protein kinase activator A homolog [Erpetoichthys calabaricus]
MACLERTMAVQDGKTPIQMLQEYGALSGTPPVFEMLRTEGPAHLPHFIFSVKIGDVTCSGQGSSKKAAKHNASEAALNILKGEAGVSFQVPKVEGSDSPKEQTNHSNIIGTLQEMAIQKGWRPPVYSATVEVGPAGTWQYSVTCRMETFEEIGNGRSKKEAKKLAAEKMVSKLKSLPECFDISGAKFKWENLKNSAAEKISLLKRTPLSLPNANYEQMLSELAQEQGFEVLYLDIDELTVNGQYQCLAELSTVPVVLCHGTGISQGNAREDAAHNVLQYLKIKAFK